MHRQPYTTLVGIFVIATVVLITFYPALHVGFFLDDWEQLNWAGRYGVIEHLFPSFATPEFRPVRALQWGLLYQLFATEPLGYHVSNILLHLANCLLLYRILKRVARCSTIAIVAALFFGTCVVTNFPSSTQDPAIHLLETAYSLAIQWPATPDALATVFLLLACNLWLSYLDQPRLWLYALVCLLTLGSVLSKETSITLPLLLGLLDLWIVHKTQTASAFIRRYAPLIVVTLVYLPIRIIHHMTSPYTSTQYSLNNPIGANLLIYLETLALPWRFNDKLSLIWLVALFSCSLYAVAKYRKYAIAFLVLSAIVTTSLHAPFYFVQPRYLYLPFIFAAIAFGWLVNHSLIFTQVRFALAGGLALIISSSGLWVVNEAHALSTVAQENVAALTSISVTDPSFPEDTLLYFVDPPIFSLALQGYFLKQYGPTVRIGSSDDGREVDLGAYNPSYVFYFDEMGKAHKQRSSRRSITCTNVMLPVNFQVPIQLTSYAIVNDTLSRGDTLVVLLNWQATGKVDRNYTIFVHLIDHAGHFIEGYDAEPQRGRLPTSALRPNQKFTSAAIISIPYDIPVSDDYSLEIGLYHQPTMQRMMIVDVQGQPMADRVTIHPIRLTK